MCYCLRALRQLDCPNGVEAVEGYENNQYSCVDLGGATADCSALKKNFLMASVVNCIQSGGSGGIGGAMVRGGGGGSGEGSGGSGGGGVGFNFDNLWALLTLLLFIIPYVVYWVKRWRARCAEAAAAVAAVPAVSYEVAEPEDGDAEVEVPAQQQQQLELPEQQQPLAIEPAPINIPLQPLIAYDLLG